MTIMKYMAADSCSLRFSQPKCLELLPEDLENGLSLGMDDFVENVDDVCNCLTELEG